MKGRRRNHGRWCKCVFCKLKRSRKVPKNSPWNSTEIPYAPIKQQLEFMSKPVNRLMFKMVGALMDYVGEEIISKLPPEELSKYQGTELTEELRQELSDKVNAEIAKAPHPEAVEPIWTSIDERQEGRSEVIREIANPKQS